MLKKTRRDATESLCTPKINTKMPITTKCVEMMKVVTNSEIDLQHCPCESRGFKIGRTSHQRFSINKVLLNSFSKSTGKHLCLSLIFDNYFKKTPLQALCYHFCEIFDNTSG